MFDLWLIIQQLNVIIYGARYRHTGEYTVGGAGKAEVYGGSDGGGGGTAFKSLENFVSGTLTAITYAFTELASVHYYYGIHYIMMLHEYIFLYSRVSQRTFAETSEPREYDDDVAIYIFTRA